MPAARVILDHVAQDPAGTIRPNRDVTITAADGTPFGGTWYDAVTGGAIVTAPQTNNQGLLKLWTDATSAQRLRVTVDGDTVPTDSQTTFDPADLWYEGMTGDRELLGSLTIGNDLTVSGDVLGPLSVTQNSDAYALVVQNSQANGKGLQVKDVGGSNLLVTRRVGTVDVVAIHTPDAYITGNSSLVVLDTKPGSFVMVDFQFDAEGAAGSDSGAMRAVARQNVAGTDTDLRAGEFQSVRATGTGASSYLWGIEVGVHSQVGFPGLPNADANVGIYISASHAGWLSTGVRLNTGVLVTGGDGWENFFLGRDTANTTQVRISGQTSGNDIVGDVITSARVRVGDGSFALPAYTFDGDLNTGMLRYGTDTIGFATGGTRRAIIDAAGNIVHGTALIATNATDGFYHMSACNGTPTGAPTAYTGTVPLVYDANANRIYARNGGTWRSVLLA